jgi:hypothetical protein
MKQEKRSELTNACSKQRSEETGPERRPHKGRDSSLIPRVAQGISKVPLLSDQPEKRASEREIISSERDSLVEDLCGSSPEIAEIHTGQSEKRATQREISLDR